MTPQKQIPIQFTKEQLARLRSLSASSGRSIAELVREAVDQYLDPLPASQISPEALWSILRDPQHWQSFKQIVAQHEPAAAPCEPPPPAEPQPVWRHPRNPEAKPRAKPPHEKPPF